MKALLEPLREYRIYQAVRDELKLRHTPVSVTGCLDGQRVHFAYALGEGFRYRLIVAENELRAKELFEDLRLYDRNVFYYPAKDIVFYNADIRGNAILKQRMEAVRSLLMGESSTVVVSIDALIDKLLPIRRLRENSITIDHSFSGDPALLREKLSAIGYRFTAEVSAPGEFSLRGGILDVFPLSLDTPYRIEFWDTEIDSIRSFDADSQRSIENVDSLSVFPATEYFFTEEEKKKGLAAITREAEKVSEHFRQKMQTEEAFRVKSQVAELKENLEYMADSVSLDSYIDYFTKDTVGLLDYFPEDETLVVLLEPVRIREKGELTAAEFAESMKGRLEKGYLLPGQLKAILPYEAVMKKAAGRRTVLLSTLLGNGGIEPAAQFDLEARSVMPYNRSFELLVKDLTTYKEQDYRVVMVCNSHTRAARLREDLSEAGLNAFLSEDSGRTPNPREIQIIYGNLRKGFCYPTIRFAVMSDGEIFGAEKKKRKKHSEYKGNGIKGVNELSFGDYVVHENYGLGIYRGIEKIEQQGVTADYIKLEYAEDGVLYVPVTNLNLVQKYASADTDKKPKLSRMGGQEWKNTKQRVRNSVKDIAKELVELYASREKSRGHEFGKDTVWQKEFEELFPYTETEDQLKAIEETKADMESPKIMDRLICGDVGYGKTEIALRAAFKAVADGMQVAILVPTTILAQQHFNTFNSRLMDFPVSVDMLCRFRTKAEQEKTLTRLKKGQLDIVIGTHRLLSKDVEFHNLGLLVIDEEQRFGVTHKEKIKQLRKNVDVLTLTATPIPRTLHMSMIGIRDMSILEEPPVDRLPIQTFVTEYNEEIIREAVNRELSRNGQVFYVHNRVNDIAEVARKVAEMCPDASVSYAHGQMDERSLENIMYDFINGDIDVLVSTTIIETGLDIANVNTIIIDGAERMGLSQLYQLRGRVGRSGRTAYAFLMYQRNRVLKEVAEKRLAAIREFTELGSGVKISMRDLEIRGAGNLLGAQQSGHMAAIGYDLYCKMLNEAVKSMKGEAVEEDEFETQVDFGMDAYIPSTYIRNEMQKLDMYKRIASIESEEELMDMQEELVDRFGDMPANVNLLLNISYIRYLAHLCYVEKLVYRDGFLVLKMYEQAKLDVGRLPEFFAAFGNRVRMTPGKNPAFTYQYSRKTLEKKNKLDILEEAKEVLGKLGELRLSPDKAEEK